MKYVLCFVICLLGAAAALPAQAGLVTVEQTRSFDFLFPPDPIRINNRSRGGQTFTFELIKGADSGSVSFDLADAVLGSLVGVELAIQSKTFPLLEAEATAVANDDGTFLPTKYDASLSGSFAVTSSVGDLGFEQMYDLSFSCMFVTPGEQCNRDPGAASPFNGVDAAATGVIADFLGAGVFDVDIVIPDFNFRTELSGDGMAAAIANRQWTGDLTLRYFFETRMPPSDVPEPGTLGLLGLGLAGLGFARRKRAA